MSGDMPRMGSHPAIKNIQNHAQWDKNQISVRFQRNPNVVPKFFQRWVQLQLIQRFRKKNKTIFENRI